MNNEAPVKHVGVSCKLAIRLMKENTEREKYAACFPICLLLIFLHALRQSELSGNRNVSLLYCVGLSHLWLLLTTRLFHNILRKVLFLSWTSWRSKFSCSELFTEDIGQIGFHVGGKWAGKLFSSMLEIFTWFWTFIWSSSPHPEGIWMIWSK